MNKKITIKNANHSKGKLVLLADESISGLIPYEQILVDSEQFSFVYLMENPEGYTYIIIPEPIWPLLKRTLAEQVPVCIQFRDDVIELSNFYDELDYVINNIRGNSNYGEEMVAKVPDMKKAIFNFHDPPKDSTLDTCPQLDWNTDPPTPITSGGQIVYFGAGSASVRKAIETHQLQLD